MLTHRDILLSLLYCLGHAALQTESARFAPRDFRARNGHQMVSEQRE